MHTLDKTAWQILNATVDDCENLEEIYRQICLDFSPENYADRGQGAYYYRPAQGAPSLCDLADHIRRLVEAGLLNVEIDENGLPLQALEDLSYIWRAWFRITPHGRSVWESSEYANVAE